MNDEYITQLCDMNDIPIDPITVTDAVKLEKGGSKTLTDVLTETNERINELFQSVSDGKELLASALTDKGIPTLATESFEEMANKIRRISGTIDEDDTFSLITKDGSFLVDSIGEKLIFKIDQLNNYLNLKTLDNNNLIDRENNNLGCYE